MILITRPPAYKCIRYSFSWLTERSTYRNHELIGAHYKPSNGSGDDLRLENWHDRQFTTDIYVCPWDTVSLGHGEGGKKG